MEKILRLFCLSVLIIIPCLKLSAQNDRDIIKSAEVKLNKKEYEPAFNSIVTVKHIKKKKAQYILRKSYPMVISENLKEANQVKISDSAEVSIICDQIKQIIYYLKDNNRADSLFKLDVSPATYKTFSKIKKSAKLLTTYETKLATMQRKAAEMEKALIDKQNAEKAAREDSIRIAKADSIAHSKEIKPVVKTDTVVTKVKPSVNKFFIIQGSYKSAEDATAEVNKLKAAGYASEITGPNSMGNIRVCYCGYATRAEAQKQLDTFRKIQSDVWILEK